MFDVKVEGLAEIQRKLRALPDKIGKNAMRRALRKGANVIRNAARNNAKRIDNPESRPSIAKNIAVSGGGGRRERQAGGVMMRVGVRGGARWRKEASALSGGNTTHWRYVEFGTSDTRAQPFMRPAMNSAASAAGAAVIAAMNTEVDKELAKLA